MFLKLTVLGLLEYPAASSDSPRADGGCRPRRDNRRAGTWCARAAALALAGATVALWPATLSAQTQPEVTIADASAEEGGEITFTMTLDTPVSGGMTVKPSYTDGTATEGTDYTANTAAVTFAGTEGETQTFTVSTTEDATVEADETFTVSVAESDSNVTVSNTATGTIRNDDSPEVTIADALADEGGEITFTVTLDKAVSGGLTVTPSFTDGTATKGTDYTENTTGLNFTGTAGETQSFTVSTTEDEVVEYGETFTVGLSVSGTSQTITATDTATGTITDDDTATVSLVAPTGTEGGTPGAMVNGVWQTHLPVTATLDKAVQGGVRVFAESVSGTATKGTDFVANLVSFPFVEEASQPPRPDGHLR